MEPINKDNKKPDQFLTRIFGEYETKRVRAIIILSFLIAITITAAIAQGLMHHPIEVAILTFPLVVYQVFIMIGFSTRYVLYLGLAILVEILGIVVFNSL